MAQENIGCDQILGQLDTRNANTRWTKISEEWLNQA